MNANDLRRTGRTARMLDEAVRLHDEGRAVYIVTATEDQRRVLADALRERFPADAPGGVFSVQGIKVETPKSASNIDWGTGQMRGAHPSCVALLDHAALELRFGWALAQWLRWSLPDPSPPKEGVGSGGTSNV